METKKDIIADAGMELTDDELEGVAGGVHVDKVGPNGKPYLVPDTPRPAPTKSGKSGLAPTNDKAWM
mgnify:CR=1 FL=1